MRAVVWNARSALLYSIGGWTMLGGVLHYSYRASGGAEGSGGPENESDPKAGEGTSREVLVADLPVGLQVTMVTTYNKELPPLTRLLRRMASFFDSRSAPPPEK